MDYNLTDAQRKEIKDMFDELNEDIKGLKTVEQIKDRLHRLSPYEVHESPIIDTMGINIRTGNKGDNVIIGIACYIDKLEKPLKVSRYVDIFFNDEEYALQDYEVK